MNHGKKMVLVPHESIEQVQKDIPQPPAPVGSYSKMDIEMKNILADKNLCEFEKYAKYEDVLHRYMSILNRQKKDVAIYLQDDEPDEDLKEEKPLQTRQEFTDVKSNVLFGLIERAADTLIKDGTLMVKGEEYGPVADLVNGAMSNKIKVKPEGWDKFSAFLSKLNIPASFVGNKDLKQYIKQKPAAVKATSTRALRSSRWVPYNGPNK
jgi:hypothetical protein